MKTVLCSSITSFSFLTKLSGWWLPDLTGRTVVFFAPQVFGVPDW